MKNAARTRPGLPSPRRPERYRRQLDRLPTARRSASLGSAGGVLDSGRDAPGSRPGNGLMRRCAGDRGDGRDVVRLSHFDARPGARDGGRQGLRDGGERALEDRRSDHREGSKTPSAEAADAAGGRDPGSGFGVSRRPPKRPLRSTALRVASCSQRLYIEDPLEGMREGWGAGKADRGSDLGQGGVGQDTGPARRLDGLAVLAGDRPVVDRGEGAALLRKLDREQPDYKT